MSDDDQRTAWHGIATMILCAASATLSCWVLWRLWLWLNF